MKTTPIANENKADWEWFSRDVRSIKKTLSDSQKREVCSWFQHTDPSPRYNAARELFEEGTCDWILRSQEWNDWIQLKTRCVWIHGIPGAGKTIIATYLIDELQSCYPENTDSKKASVYYYCYHGRDQDEELPFLRWLICQLCRILDGISDPVYAVFKRGREPSRDDLLSCLESTLRYFETVFVVVDALDESQEREKLLKLLQLLGKDPRFGNLQLLATSRQYLDIETAMMAIAEPISMSNPLVQADIELFVRSQISSTPMFKKWPQNLRDEVEKQLSEEAKGMFRWAVCQLEILRRLRYESKIREAIYTLPESLDETYERIFALIPSEDWTLVRHTLFWVYSWQHIDTDYESGLLDTPVMLATYFSANGQKTGGISEDATLIDAETLKDLWGCLITFDDDSHARFAHYTVREYLESARSSSQSTAFFRMEINEADYHAHEASIKLLTIPPDDCGKLMKATQLEMDVLITLRNEILVPLILSRPWALSVEAKLILDLFDPFSHCVPGLSDSDIDYVIWLNDLETSGSGRLRKADWSSLKASRRVATFLRLSDFGWFHLAERCFAPHLEELYFEQFSWQSVEWDSEHPKADPSMDFEGNIIEFLAYNSNCKSEYSHFQSLLDDVKAKLDYCRLLYLLVAFHDCTHYHDGDGNCWLAGLLARGVSPEPATCQVTPLQIAVARRDRSAVPILLEAGADPRACGDPNQHELEGDNLLSRFSSLSGKKPLFILRQIPEFVDSRNSVIHLSWEEMDDDLDLKMEQLLLEAGAEDSGEKSGEESGQESG